MPCSSNNLSAKESLKIVFKSFTLNLIFVNSLREIFIKRDSPHGRKRTPNVLIVPDDVINVEQTFMGPIK